MSSLVWMLLTIPSAAAPEEVVRFDFETGDLQGWQVVEGQFDYVVSDRAVFHNRYPDQPGNKYNKQGQYYLSTVEQQPGKPSNDRMTGVVESPVFVLDGPEMSMLVGSGTQPGTYVALCTLDGKEVLVARGKDQTEVMQRVRWDAPQLVGQKVFLRVVDRETGGWGHVTLDDFTARGRIDGEATQRRFAEIEARLARQRLEMAIRECNLPGLRRAIADLMETLPDAIPAGNRVPGPAGCVGKTARGGYAGADAGHCPGVGSPAARGPGGQPAGRRPADRLCRPAPVPQPLPRHRHAVPHGRVERRSRHDAARRLVPGRRGAEDHRLGHRPRPDAAGSPRRRRPRSRGPFRRPADRLRPAPQPGRGLSHLGDPGRRHGTAGSSPRPRACRTSIRSTCPTTASPSRRRASRSTTSAAATTGPTCSAWSPTGRTSTRSARTTCSTTTARSRPTAASCMPAGNTWTATSATPTASGRSIPTARTRRSTGATTRPRPARSTIRA